MIYYRGGAARCCIKMKAQMKIAENIMIMVVFFILLVLGFVFYARVSGGTIQKEAAEFRQKESIKVSQRAAYLPETRCSKMNKVIDDCFDIFKLEFAAEIMETDDDVKLYYFDTFGYAKIFIEEIYPDEKVYMLYDNVPEEYSSKFSTPIPVSLFNASADSFALGVLYVESYS